MARLLIGIAGGSGSGKTTLAKDLADEIGKEKVLLFSMDRYYKDLSRLKISERKKVDFDNPAAIEWPLFRKQVKQLLKNREIKAPIYDFAFHTRKGYEAIKPKPIIIIEGIFALYDIEITKLIDVRLFVETPADIRLLRRIKRDVAERGYDFDSILKQWLNQVRPAYQTFIEPTATKAHLIVPEDPEGRMRETAVRIIKTYAIHA